MTKLIQKIIEPSILTGSRAWGTEKADSDWDYIVKRELFDKIINPHIDKFTPCNLFEADNYESGEDGLLLQLKHADKTYHFIIRENEHDRKAWVNTTFVLKQFPISVLTDRNVKLQLFHAVLDGFRGNLK